MKYVGPLLFSLGVVIAISGGAKVPETRQQAAAAKVKAANDEAAVTAAKEKAEGPKEVRPKPESELRTTALTNIANKEADEKKTKPAAKEIKLEMPTTKWYFLCGILCAGAGLGLWWKDIFSSRATAALADSKDDSANPLALLKETLAALQAFRLRDRDAEELCGQVDAILTQFVLPMMDVRQKLTERLGMNVGAEILVTAAAGERMLNRAWSAAADGDMDEALESVRMAKLAFAEAQAIVDSAT